MCFLRKLKECTFGSHNLGRPKRLNIGSRLTLFLFLGAHLVRQPKLNPRKFDGALVPVHEGSSADVLKARSL